MVSTVADIRPQSVITFYRLPKAAREQSYENAWAVVEHDPASVSMIGMDHSQLPPGETANDVAVKLGNPRDEFNYLVEERAEEGANYLFVGCEDEKPVWGCPI